MLRCLHQLVTAFFCFSFGIEQVASLSLFESLTENCGLLRLEMSFMKAEQKVGENNTVIQNTLNAPKRWEERQSQVTIPEGFDTMNDTLTSY